METEQRMSSIKNYIEFVLSLSFCLFIIGYIIVHFYYGMFGFYPGEIISINYLSASLIFLFSIWIFIYGFESVKEYDSKGKKRIDVAKFITALFLVYSIWVGLFRLQAFKSYYFTKIYYPLYIYIGALFLIIVPLILHRKNPSKITDNHIFLTHSIFIISFLDHIFLFYIAWNFLIVHYVSRAIRRLSKMGSEKFTDKDYWQVINFVRPLVFFLLTYAAVFGGYLYPLIPQYFGGGKPLDINLLIMPDKKTSFVSMGFEVGKDNWVNGIMLIYRGKNSLFLENKKSSTRFTCVEISTDMVKSIQYTGGIKLTAFELISKGIPESKNN